MALIKCPECDKNVSDKAESCPHCGYEINKKTPSTKVTKNSFKWDNKYLIVILLLLVGGCFIFFNNSKKKDPNTNLKPNANGYYEFNQNGKFFEFPTDYKVYIGKDNTIYVAKNIDDKGALIPYIMIEKYKGYSSPEVLLSELTTEIGKEYSDATITINLLSAYLGNKYTYGMQFAYTSNGHLVIDNRYAFLVNNSMYLVTTKEENVNTNEINNVSRIIIESLKEVN